MNYTIKLSKDIMKLLDELKKKTGHTGAAVIRDAIKRYHGDVVIKRG